MIRNILNTGEAIRRIGTMKVDLIGQRELFFQENQQQRQFYLVKDGINNRHGVGTTTTASSLDAVGGKTHFIDRS